MSTALQTSALGEGKVLMKLMGSITSDRLTELDAGIEEGERIVKEEGGKCDNKVKIYFDLTEFDGAYDARAMEHIARLAKNDAPYVYKTACYGGPKLAMMLVELVANLSGRENLRFFDTKEEADAWINM